MKKKYNYLLLLILLFITCSHNFFSVAEAALMADAPIRCSIRSIATGAYDKGYCVYLVRIANNTSRKLNVKIRLTNQSGYRNDEKYIVEKQVEVMPAGTSGVDREERLYFPNTDSYKDVKVSFIIDGVIYEEDRIEKMLTEKGSSYYSSTRYLIDKNISNYENLFKDSSIGSRYITYVFEGRQDEMDKDWVAYSQFDYLIFYASSIESGSEAVTKAILEYVKLGGNLVIIGDVSNNFLNMISGETSSNSKDEVKGFSTTFNSSGSGSLFSSTKSSSNDALVGELHYGLGRILFYKKDTFDLMRKSLTRKDSYSYYGKSEKEKAKEEEEEKKKLAAMNVGKIYEPSMVIRKMDTPTTNFSKDCFAPFRIENVYRGEYRIMRSPIMLVILVLLFAILLGPVNFFILHKYKAKIMVFVTVPVISIICCSIVFIYFFLFEYFRLDVFRQSFTLLDERNNTAATIGAELIISGKTMNNSLSFPLSSVIFQNNIGRKNSNGNSREISLDRFQNLTYEWIKPKTPFAFSLASTRQERAKLEITETSDGLDLLNLLGADIEYACILSNDGSKLYEADKIRAGAHGKANFIESLKNYRNNRKIKDSYRDLLNQQYSNSNLKSYAKTTLKPGEYIVYLKTDPFMKQNFDRRANIRELGCFVHGTPKKGGSL